MKEISITVKFYLKVNNSDTDTNIRVKVGSAISHYVCGTYSIFERYEMNEIEVIEK